MRLQTLRFCLSPNKSYRYGYLIKLNFICQVADLGTVVNN